MAQERASEDQNKHRANQVWKGHRKRQLEALGVDPEDSDIELDQ